MAVPTVSSNPAVQEQYAAQLAITASLFGSMRALWLDVDPLSSAAALARYTTGLEALATHYGKVARASGVDFYTKMRREADVRKRRAGLTLVPTPPATMVQADIDWAIRAQAEVEREADQIQQAAEVALQKAVIDIGRNQVITAVAGDEQAVGFHRVARAGACYFCIAQAIRRNSEGHVGVYKSRGTAGSVADAKFTGSGVAKFHNNCHCVIEPVFEFGSFDLSPAMADMETLYAESTVSSKRGQSMNDFRKALRAQRGGVTPPSPVPTVPAMAPLPGNDALGALLDRLAASGARPAA